MSHSSMTRIRFTGAPSAERGGQRRQRIGVAARPTASTIAMANRLPRVTGQVCANLSPSRRRGQGALRHAVGPGASSYRSLDLLSSCRENFADADLLHRSRRSALPHHLLMLSRWSVPAGIARRENGGQRNPEGVGDMHCSAVVAKEEVAASDETHQIAQTRLQVAGGIPKRQPGTVTVWIDKDHNPRAVAVGERVCDLGKSGRGPPLIGMAAADVKSNDEIARRNAHRLELCCGGLPLFRKEGKPRSEWLPVLASSNGFRSALRAERFHELEPVLHLVVGSR